MKARSAVIGRQLMAFAPSQAPQPADSPCYMISGSSGGGSAIMTGECSSVVGASSASGCCSACTGSCTGWQRTSCAPPCA